MTKKEYKYVKEIIDVIDHYIKSTYHQEIGLFLFGLQQDLQRIISEYEQKQFLKKHPKS